MALVVDHDDYTGWVQQLADPVRAQRAFWHLVVTGAPALDAVRSGLRSDDPEVRRWCTKAMDHLVDDSAFPTLVSMLDDPDPRVRVEACHALACDRCKDNTCRADAHMVLPRAIDVVRNDPDRHVRAYAIELVARWVHSHPHAEAAIIDARDHDSDPSVRKKAGWYAPGGTIHRRTAPR